MAFVDKWGRPFGIGDIIYYSQRGSFVEPWLALITGANPAIPDEYNISNWNQHGYHSYGGTITASHAAIHATRLAVGDSIKITRDWVVDGYVLTKGEIYTLNKVDTAQALLVLTNQHQRKIHPALDRFYLVADYVVAWMHVSTTMSQPTKQFPMQDRNGLELKIGDYVYFLMGNGDPCILRIMDHKKGISWIRGIRHPDHGIDEEFLAKYTLRLLVDDMFWAPSEKAPIVLRIIAIQNDPPEFTWGPFANGAIGLLVRESVKDFSDRCYHFSPVTPGTQLEINLPKNNDGRKTCAFCPGEVPTRKAGMGVYDICTKCGR